MQDFLSFFFCFQKQQICKFYIKSQKNQKNANPNVLESLQQDLQLSLHAHIYILFIF